MEKHLLTKLHIPRAYFISDLISHVQVLMIQFYHFLPQTDLSKYNNVTVFLAPGVVSMHRYPFSIYTELSIKILSLKISATNYIIYIYILNSAMIYSEEYIRLGYSGEFT